MTSPPVTVAPGRPAGAVDKCDVKDARKRVKRADRKLDTAKAGGPKRAVEKAARKLRKAKRNLKHQKAQWCAKAQDETAATNEAQRLVTIYDTSMSSDALGAMPSEVGDPDARRPHRGAGAPRHVARRDPWGGAGGVLFG